MAMTFKVKVNLLRKKSLKVSVRLDHILKHKRDFM